MQNKVEQGEHVTDAEVMAQLMTSEDVAEVPEVETKLRLYRQGDVLFMPVTEEKFKELVYNRESALVASPIIVRGANTHRIAEDDFAKGTAQLYNVSNRATNWATRVGALMLLEKTTIIHEQHGALVLFPQESGTFYQIIRAREFDPVAALPRMVAD